MSHAKIGTSPGHWFVRGILVGCLFVGASNALSYFVRSDNFGNLLDKPGPHKEVIGFPWEIWQAGRMYDGFYMDHLALGCNFLFALATGIALGSIMVWHSKRLNRLVEYLAREYPEEKQQLQFSLRDVLTAMVLASICSAAAANFGSHPNVLVAIYVFGPLALILFAFLPRRISWQQRVAILTPAAFAMIAVAVTVGISLGMEFDRVLIGIFICWTPQSAFAALALTIATLVIHYRKLNATQAN